MKKKYLIYLCGLVLIAAIIIGGIIAGANLSYKGESVSVKNSSSSSDSSETGEEEPTEEAKPVSYKGVVFAGDSILEDVYNYVPIKKAKYVVKSGMGTYTFYESDYFDAGKTSATGVEMVIKYKAQTVFMCFGMNESVFKDDKGIIEYYAYAVEDIREELPDCKFVILAVPPTKEETDETIPDKARIDELNASLEEFAKDYNCDFYDYTEPFKDDNGFLKDEYDGGLND